MSCRSVFCFLSNNYMISFKSSKCNIISQSQYDSEIRRCCSCISSFPCPFCESCSLVFYGRYPTRICVPDSPEFIIIRVQRVFCTHCGRGQNLKTAPKKRLVKRFSKIPYHSNSIVPGGLLVMSYITLLTPFTSLMIRVIHVCNVSNGISAAVAVIKSEVITPLNATA